MSDIPLKGTILGFEEYREYVLRNIFDDASPFRVLACLEEHIAFLVVNPFVVAEDYNLEIDDAAASNLGLTGENMQHVAVLCVARKENDHYTVNLRSPLIINTVEEPLSAGHPAKRGLRHGSYHVSEQGRKGAMKKKFPSISVCTDSEG